MAKKCTCPAHNSRGRVFKGTPSTFECALEILDTCRLSKPNGTHKKK